MVVPYEFRKLVEAVIASRPGGSSSLAGLSDVVLTALANGDLIGWNAGLAKFVNVAPSGGSLQKATVTLAAADILALNGTPFELVPAQGANTLIAVHKVFFLHHFGTANYPFSTTFRLGVTGANETVIPAQVVFSFGSLSRVSDVSTGFAGGLAAATDAPFQLSSPDSLSLGAIATWALNAAGQGYQVGQNLSVFDGSSDAIFQVTAVTTASDALIGVDQGAQTFTIAGDQTAHHAAGFQVSVTGSTGNDGTYNEVDAVFGGVNTVLTVGETIPDPTIDGALNSLYGPITALSLSYPGSALGPIVGGATEVLGGGLPGIFGATIDVLTVALGDGTLDVITYFTVEAV